MRTRSLPRTGENIPAKLPKKFIFKKFQIDPIPERDGLKSRKLALTLLPNMSFTYNGEDFTWLKSRQNPLNVGSYSFLFSEAIQNFELQYSFIPHSAHNKSRNTYTQNEIQLKLISFSQQAHGLTRRLGYLLRLVSKLPKKVIPRKIFAIRYAWMHVLLNIRS